MYHEAVLLYDRDRFLGTMLERVRESLQRSGAEHRPVVRYWCWDPEQVFVPGEIV